MKKKKKQRHARPIEREKVKRSEVSVPKTVSPGQSQISPEGADHDSESLLTMQRHIGNRAVQRVLTPRLGAGLAPRLGAGLAPRLGAELAQHSGQGPVEAQATWHSARRLRSAQRRTLASQIGRTQGSWHVQRGADTPHVLRKEEKVFKKKEFKTTLSAILGLEWMSQSNCKAPIKLTKRLTAVIQMVTPLSTEDIKLLWRVPPRTPSEALKNLDHSLPATIPASLMKKLENAKLSLVMFGGKVKSTKESTPTPKEEPKALAGIKEKEELFKAIVDALKGKEPEDKSKGTEALKKSLEAFFETETGKKVKERGLELLLSKKGLPFTLMVGSSVLAAMIANNTDIPSTPEIPLSDNLSVKVEFKGTFHKPEAVKFVLKFAFGGPAKREREKKKPAVLALPADLHAYIGKIDKNTLIKWIVQRAYYEWEVAGPEWEEEKKKFYQAARDRPEDLGLPDTRLAAEALSRALVERAIQNRINQLKGKGVQKRLDFDLGHADLWDRFFELKGLAPRLEWLLNLLVPKVPYKALGIEQVAFICGKRLIPVKVKR